MGLGTGSSGLGRIAAGVTDVLAALVGQDIVARSIELTRATGLIALQMVDGARLKLGTGTTDYLTSDGATTITAAGSLNATNLNTSAGTINITGSSGAIDAAIFRVTASGSFGLASTFAIRTAPTVVAGAGAAIVASNGTAAFNFDAGGAAQTGTITFPAATTGWVVYMQDVTTPASFVFGQTGGTATTATFTCYSRTTGLAINWTANDIIRCIAMAY